MPTRWLNRRLIARACIFMLLGVIINLAVAWGLAIGLDFRRAMGELPPEVQEDYYRDIDNSYFLLMREEVDVPPSDRFPGIVIVRWRRTGAERVTVSSLYVTSGMPPEPNPRTPEDLLSPWAQPVLQVHDVRTQAVPNTGQEWHYWDSIADARGWPMLCLMGGVRRPMPGAYVYDANRRRIILTEQRIAIIPLNMPDGRYRTDEFRWLPLRPIWPGFAFNTMLYATATWLLFALPTFQRRRWRTARGRCPTCNYDLRATTTGVCPECGAAITPRAAT
ncbi:MAG: hypothetical protein IT430_03590 [Phycisphaerales bacterium]|nr:hypothetical protein [Phycisphaerales bacterium]